MNARRQIQVCYIDIIDEQGNDTDGVPYFYDLYLDLVVYPDGTIIKDDMDELENAFRDGDISQQQFDLALRTSDHLISGLLSNKDEFKQYIEKMYRFIQE